MLLSDYGLDEAIEGSYLSLGLDGTLLGRVVRSDTGRSRVVTERGEMDAVHSGKVMESGRPIVGDWVVLKDVQGILRLVLVLPRRTRISRKAPGKGEKEQLVAANVDLIMIVMGMDADLNLRRLERYMVILSASGADGAVVLNKMDLVEDPTPLVEDAKRVAQGIPVIAISALEGGGLPELEPLLGKGRTVCLLGSSGSGKSTLINRLLGEDRLRTNEVGDRDKGRHTTTSRELYLLPSGALVIDNPGIREVQLWAEEGDLDPAFPEIESLSRDCRFKDCQHLAEPGCAVLGALEGGSLPRDRYDSYQKMKKELRYLSRTGSSESEERAKWRNIHKNIKHYDRYKKERS
jgi:ribosome biogenesis GTPase